MEEEDVEEKVKRKRKEDVEEKVQRKRKEDAVENQENNQINFNLDRI